MRCWEAAAEGGGVFDVVEPVFETWLVVGLVLGRKEVLGEGYIRDVLWRVWAMYLSWLTRWSGRAVQTFRASMKASRTPLEGSEPTYSAGASRRFKTLASISISFFQMKNPPQHQESPA